jgi:hypothetical protein
MRVSRRLRRSIASRRPRGLSDSGPHGERSGPIAEQSALQQLAVAKELCLYTLVRRGPQFAREALVASFER